MPTHKRALATIGTGPMEPVLALAAVTFRAYADRHGYDLVIGDGESEGRPPSWGKVLLICDLLDRYEEVLWVDSDAIILDGRTDIADAVPAEAYLAVARPQNPWPGGIRMLNFGVFLIRGECGRQLLRLVWNREQWIDHGTWEQRAVLDVLGFDEQGVVVTESEWRTGVHWLPDEWNTLEWIDGLGRCRIRHYSARDNQFRSDRMKIDLAYTRRDPRAWLMDLQWRRSQFEYRKKRLVKLPVLREIAKVKQVRRDQRRASRCKAVE